MSTPTPDVSVVLPVYNGSRYLSTCLESIQTQAGVRFELVAADDGSTDGSGQLLERARDSRVRVLTLGARQGLFRTLNRLVAAATAPVVKIVCQDDELVPGCLERVAAFMADHPAVGMLFHKSVIVDEMGVELRRDRIDDLPAELPPPDAAQHLFFHGCIPGNLSTVALRREAFDQAGGFDPGFQVSGDYDLWVRLARSRPLGVLQARLVRLRAHAGQLSRQPLSGVSAVMEDQGIRAALLNDLPADLRPEARAYEARRHHVLAWHFAVRALFSAKPSAFARVVRSLGPRGTAEGLVHWVLTGNNHWRRPVAPLRLST